MTKKIEQQIIEFTNQISNKLDTHEQEILNQIINNYINLSKNLNKIADKHNKEH